MNYAIWSTTNQTKRNMKAQTRSNKSKAATLLSVGMLLVLFFIGLNTISDELKYFGMDKEVLGRYWDVKWWLIGHLSGGILALLLGPFQFWSYFRNRYRKLHRGMGKIYLIAILVASLLSIYMAWTISIKTHFTWALSLQVLSFTWLATSFMAYRAIRKGRITQHREWMIRSYIVTFVFVAFRWINEAMGDAEIGTFVERAPTIIYLTIFIPLLVAEILFQWNRK